LESYSLVQRIRGSFVQQIEPAKDAMRMEEAVKLFSMAFELGATPRLNLRKILHSAFFIVGVTFS
jgi:hypothetical protein